MLASSLLRRSGLTIIQAEADALPLADESVNCVVTSPPYWNLRSYNAGKGEIGLEKTPQEYVERMVAVFRGVRRVLRNDGNVWLNLGDCYTGNRSYQVPDSKHINVGNSRGMKASEIGLKPKDLVGIPWRVAFALQADGWYLRTDIVYSKPNPMPESVADRPTRSHEFVFLLTKNEKYFTMRPPFVSLIPAQRSNGSIRALLTLKKVGQKIIGTGQILTDLREVPLSGLRRG